MERKTRQRALWGLLTAWILVAGVAVVTVVAGEEDDLTARSETALAAAGLGDVAVAFEGRDALVLGLTVDRAATMAVLASVEGVRRVEWSDDGVAASGGTAVLPPPTTAAPLATSTTTSTRAPATTTTSTTTTTTAPPTTTTTTAVVSSEGASLSASLVDGTLTLTGTIPDAESAARIAAVADLIYAPFVVNELVVDPDVPGATWVPGAAGTIAVLPIVGRASIDVSGQQAVLTASAGSPEKAALLQGALQAALGPDVTLATQVEVTGLRPPVFEGRVGGDGILLLTGEMPDQAAVDRIAGAAVQVYGTDGVVNELVVGDGVESTFSLFRVPLIFGPLQPVPEWEVIIRNDVISGGLRGGATFAFGSAELTPELQRLAGIAAGIMTRNPTIAITIEGHTDNIGSPDFNQRLSVARAEAATTFIAGLGVDPSRLTAVGYGEDRPIADNGTDAGRAQNRRIEFVMGPAGPEGDE